MSDNFTWQDYEWGVKANYAEPRKAIRARALCWVTNINPGWGGERIEVYARSKGGRIIRTWIASKRLTNFRAGWVAENQRSNYGRWTTKESAADWAGKMNAWNLERHHEWRTQKKFLTDAPPST